MSKLDLVDAAQKLSASEFGKQLKQTREGRGLSQEDAARAVGITASALSKWEQGKAAPRLNALSRLSRVLNEQTPIGDARPGSADDPRIRILTRYRNIAIEGVELLYEFASQGSGTAEEQLRKSAVEINRIVGNLSLDKK